MIEAGKCLVLIRDPERTYEAALAERSAVIYTAIVEPSASANGLVCQRIDPTEYGPRDERLFALLATAEVVVVDSAAHSMDYAYSLGVRHALSDKPTFILAEMEYIPFDVSFPRGVLPMRRGTPGNEECDQARQWLTDEIRSSLGGDQRRYSPVRKALDQVPRVFLSYAHADRESVAAVDQWLRDHDVRVDLDERDFVAGRDIRDEVVRCINQSGKVICFYSVASKDRYYTKLERRLAEEIEQQAAGAGQAKVVLLYFRLDETPLPAESSYRLAINAWKMGFSEACKDLLRHLLERSAESARVPLTRYRHRPPWRKE